MWLSRVSCLVIAPGEQGTEEVGSRFSACYQHQVPHGGPPCASDYVAEEGP